MSINQLNVDSLFDSSLVAAQQPQWPADELASAVKELKSYRSEERRVGKECHVSSSEVSASITDTGATSGRWMR